MSAKPIQIIDLACDGPKCEARERVENVLPAGWIEIRASEEASKQHTHGAPVLHLCGACTPKALTGLDALYAEHAPAPDAS